MKFVKYESASEGGQYPRDGYSWTEVECRAGHRLVGEGLPETFGLNGPCPLCGKPIISIVPHPNYQDQADLQKHEQGG